MTSSPKQRLLMISFRIDEETLAALQRLEDAIAGGIVNKRRRSIAIRKALLEADQRCSQKVRGIKEIKEGPNE